LGGRAKAEQHPHRMRGQAGATAAAQQTAAQRATAAAQRTAAQRTTAALQCGSACCSTPQLLGSLGQCAAALRVTACGAQGLSRKQAHSEQEALAAFFTAEAARARAQTHRNGASSRSHAIFHINLEIRRSAEASEKALVARLTFADLAGSERAKKANAQGQVMREAAFINRSLSFLDQVCGAHALCACIFQGGV
jgi:Kinesin motor domain